MTHWAVQYIGIPWENGAQGPESFDCWAFVRHIQREHFSVEVPPINVDASQLSAVVRAFTRHPELIHWQRVQTPQDGDCVLLSSNRFPAHVGVWVSGAVLHCKKGPGVVHQTPAELSLSGWGGMAYFRHIGS